LFLEYFFINEFEKEKPKIKGEKKNWYLKNSEFFLGCVEVSITTKTIEDIVVM